MLFEHAHDVVHRPAGERCEISAAAGVEQPPHSVEYRTDFGGVLDRVGDAHPNSLPYRP